MIKHDLIKEVLITEEQLQKRITELAAEISEKYQNTERPLVLLGVLRGCLPFISDFMMKLAFDSELELMRIKSYVGQLSTTPEIKFDLFGDIKDRDVLIIEDIIDTGKTLSKLIAHLKSKQPKSLKILTLLDKKERRIVAIDVDWVGFEMPDEFLVGYGLDYQEKMRNLPYIASLDTAKIEN